LGNKLVSELVKLPMPVPSTVLGLAIVGTTTHQHTPRAVIGEPPSEVIVPPLWADVGVMRLTAVVESIGIIGGVVFPPFPSEFFEQLINIMTVIKRIKRRRIVFMLLCLRFNE
jgi:hypothetical protein